MSSTAKTGKPQAKMNEGSNKTAKTDKSSPHTKERSSNLQACNAENPTIVTANDLKNNIKNCNKNPCDTNINEVLVSVYKFVKAKSKLSKVEEKELGKLLKETLQPIFNYLLNFTYDFQPTHLQEMLIYRSTVQFLVDELKLLPMDDKGEKLGEVVGTFLTKSEIKNAMDETIARWKNNITYEKCVEFRSLQDLKKPDGVPDSHTWWERK